MNRFMQLRSKLDIPSLDEVTVKFERRRCFLPTAYCYPEMKLIIVEGNPASLERYGLAELICHELAEYEYYHQNNSESMHNDDFRLIESKYREIIEDIIREEHE